MTLLQRFSAAAALSCGIAYAAGSCFTLIFSPDIFWITIPFLYYGFVFLLFGPHHLFRLKLSKDFLLGLILGSCLGLFSICKINYEHANCYHGMEIKQVRSVEGTLQQDGSRKGTRVVLLLGVHAVEDRMGNRHSARFNLAALVPYTGKYFAGDRVRLQGHFVPDGGGIFFGDANCPPVLLYRPVLASIRSYVLHNAFHQKGEHLALLEALCFGIKDGLEEELGIAFRKSGTSHILALSGMHVGILVLFLQVVMGPLFKPLTRKVIVSVFLIVYWLLVGPFPSLVRAILMYGIYTIALLMGRKIHSLDLLSHSFLLSCFLFPHSVLSYSSILSYTAVGGIFILSQPLQRRFRSILFDPFLSAVSVSLGAQIATAPLTLYFFSHLALFGWLASIVLSPLITLFMWMGLLSIMVGGFPFLNPYLQGTLEFLYTAIVYVAETFAKFPAIQLP